MKQVNVCLVGSGNMAKIRLNTVANLPAVKVTSIVSKSKALSLPITDDIPVFASLKDLPEILVKETNAFIVCNRTSDHVSTLTDIFSVAIGDVFVFIEKPVAATDTDITKVFKECPSNVAICCGFQRRFDPSYVSLKNAIHAKAIGEPNYCRVFFADHPVPKLDFLLKDGCPFMDLTPHDIDFVRWCLQDEVEAVSASGSSTIPELKEHGVLDNIVVTLKFKKGCLVHMFCNRSCSYGYDQRCEFFGKEGRAEVDNLPRHGFKMFNSAGQTAGILEHSYPQRFAEAFDVELKTFIQVCRGEAQWPVSFEDCVAVQKIAMAAAEACKTGSTIRL